MQLVGLGSNPNGPLIAAPFLEFCNDHFPRLVETIFLFHQVDANLLQSYNFNIIVIGFAIRLIFPEPILLNSDIVFVVGTESAPN